MSRYALMDGDLVENVIVWDGITEYKVPGKQLVLRDDVSPGDMVINDVVIKKIEPTPVKTKEELLEERIKALEAKVK